MSDTDALLRTMLELSPGDRSLLELASSGKAGDQPKLHTTRGSWNFRLCTQMVEHGWMVRLPDPTKGIPPTVEAAEFELTDAGKSAMPGFLSDFAQYRDRRTAKMTEIFNGPCRTFTKTFQELMKNSGATEKDYVLLTAFTVAGIITDVFRPQSWDHTADFVLDLAKKRMAEMAPRKPD